ncbi:hypothetical protein ACVIGB_000630 [Bradyrhizobium sp. USDA 4341]
MATFAATLTDSFDRPVSGLVERLLAATAMTRVARRGGFDNFGAVVGVRPSNMTLLRETYEQISENVEFGVEEARRRLKSFVEGKVAFKAFGDMTSYLSGKLLKIETRIYGDGRSANYLVDRVSRKAVPAAQVDRRLSVNGVKKMMGSTVEEEAAVKARTSKRNPDALAAFEVRGMVRELMSGGGLPFKSWSEMDFTLRNVADERRYTVQGGKAWIGREYAVASADPKENLALFARAKADGLKLIVPATLAKDAREGKLEPGMPILLREGAAPAAMVDPGLAHGTLERAFGESLFEFNRERQQRSRGRSGFSPSNVVSISQIKADDFLQRFMRRDVDESEGLEREGAFGGIVAPVNAASIVVRRVIGQDGRAKLVVRDGGADADMSIEARSLPANVYPLDDSYGNRVGFMRVDEQGSLLFFDEQMRAHNEHGPAYDPAPGSLKRPSWSIAGRELSPAEFRDVVTAPQPQVQPMSPRRAAAGGGRRAPPFQDDGYQALRA